MPQRLADIPGLGPIRIRALQKAGLSSLRSVKAATLEQLQAVPGMSEIKARHIQQFLAPFDTLPDLAPTPPVQSPAPNAPRRQGIALYTAHMEMAAQAENISLGMDAAPIMARALRLLIGDYAPGYRARLLRELARFVRRTELAQDHVTALPERERERILRRLRRSGELLAQAEERPDMDRKTQNRLAEELADASARLADALGIIDLVVRSEDHEE